MEVSRRDVMRGAAYLSAAAAMPIFLEGIRRAEAAGGGDDDRILVVLEMTGGNDGLATVVPYEDDALYRYRSSTAIRPEEVLRIEPVAGIGLHPNLSALRPLYDQGRVAIVLGAGYPHPNRSHFESMDIWHTASTEGRRVPTGWLGRAVDACCAGKSDAELAVRVGTSIPYAMRADVHKAIAFQQANAYRWNREAGPGRAAFADLNGAPPGDEAPGTTLARLHRTAEDARASSERVRKAASDYKPKVAYPGGSLARDLSLVAALIDAGLPTRVAYVAMGGFDTHAAQRVRHDALMRELGDAVAAFLGDLDAHGHGDRVTMLAFSEFGRRTRENASQGTDHGEAAPMFLFGKPLRGGLYGRQPSFGDLDDGDIKMTTDFRRAYATVLDRWIGAPSKTVLGDAFAPLGFLA
jgi:uncharacterized protein (DUF1501 family)